MGSSLLQRLCCALALISPLLVLQNVEGYGLSDSFLIIPYNLTDIFSKTNCKFTELGKYLSTSLNYVEYNLTYEIYTALVKNVRDFQPAYLLVEDLWSTYQKGDSSTFLTMVRSQLVLFWMEQKQNNDNLDTKYLLKAAYSFRKIKNDPLYKCLNENDKRNLEQSINSLPSSLKYLFFKGKFCLLNNMYSEVLYQAGVDVDSTTRYAFTWSGEKYIAKENGWITPIFLGSDEDKTLDVNMNMYGNYFKGLYYRDEALGNLIVANRTEKVLNTTNWMVHLLDDENILLQQNGYTMCATGSHDNDRRFVSGFSSPLDIHSNCFWSPGECDRRNNK